MAMETGFLQRAMALLREEYAQDVERLGIRIPDVSAVPCIRFDEAKRLAAERYGYSIRDPYDLEPEEEHAIGRYAREVWESDFVFVTHYPSKKRPFYAMDDPEDPKYTLSFDLLFRGLEVTTGDSASTTTELRWRRWRHGAWTRRILRAISWPIDMACPPTAAWASDWSG